MPKYRYFLYTEKIDTAFQCHKGRINLPTRINKIVGICPSISKGSDGFITIGRVVDNELFVNSVKIADDHEVYDKKNIKVEAERKNSNFFYVYRAIKEVEVTRDSNGRVVAYPQATLKILITYIE